LLTLATIVKKIVSDTYIYSESVSKIKWDDVLDADIVFIGIFTFNAQRGYKLASYIKDNSNAIVVMGGMHASLHYSEAVRYCDYVLVGEGDESIVEFIESVNNNTPIAFPGIAYEKGGNVIFTGERTPPADINTIPDRYLLYNYHKMAGHNTLWAQVHASRGCPHNCDYCAVIRHLGRKVRTRTPENVLEDIKKTIQFHDNRFFPRLNRVLWLTDDNFFADRDWAIAVLNAIISSGIKYRFTIQARYEVGFDDEMLVLLKKAGFFELAFGIEFLEDESFQQYGKKCTYAEVVEAVKNVQRHGLNARGLFIVGADSHTKGIGQKIVDFVHSNGIHGILIQSMYFVPSTPAFDTYKDRLIHQDWSKYTGNVVHYPANISPYDLQKEMIYAISKIYSVGRLLRTLLREKWYNKILYVGEFFWQRSIRSGLKRELKNLPKT
jgi:radical SAM superfamily enzyme YgiQ (UPF0313 family)